MSICKKCRKTRLSSVDNASKDGTAERCRSSFPSVQIVELEHNLGIHARNIGVIKSDTPFISFCDDDSWWEGNSLEKAAALFQQHPTLGLATGKVLVGRDNHLEPACRMMQNSPLPNTGNWPGKPVLGFISCAAVVRKSHFLECGGFEGKYLVGGEENLLALELRQCGYGVVYVDSMVAHHHPARRNQQRRLAMLVRNNIRTCWLKRQWPFAVSFTVQILRHCDNPLILKGFIMALTGLPWIAARRNPAGPDIENEIALLGKQSVY